MAFETATATGPTDLLQKLVTFLAANGWTTDASATDGSGWRAHLHKGSQYVNLRASENESGIAASGQVGTGYTLNMYLGTGYSGASGWRDQAGGPIADGETYTVFQTMNTGNGTFAYFFFSDATDDNVAVVTEPTAENYFYLGWGALEKAGAFTGGAYFFGSVAGNYQQATGTKQITAFCPFFNGQIISHSGFTLIYTSGYVRADVDAFTGKWLCCTNDSLNPGGRQRGYTGKFLLSSVPGSSLTVEASGGNWVAGSADYRTAFPTFRNFAGRLTSAFNARANLIPILLWAVRDDGGVSPLGVPPTIFRTTGVGEGFGAASEYTVGPDTYMMFPNFAVRKVA